MARKSERAHIARALRHRNYKLFFSGQSVSLMGTWITRIATSWLVYRLTNSALLLGVVGFCGQIPTTLLAPFAGVAVDRVNRHRMLVWTQVLSAAQSLALAVLAFSGTITVAWILFLQVVQGIINAFDTPARQALMPTLVPIEDFPNAVSLAVIVFNVATIAGPAIAGFLLAESGPAIIYGINALSFVAVIGALIAMRASGQPELQTERKDALSLAALKEGLSFVWHTPIIVQTMTLDFVATFFASATLLLPIFAQERLHVGARGYGFLAAAPAIGSVLTALVMARLGTLHRQGRLVVASVAVFGVATAGFGVSTVYWVSLLMLAITGAADTVSTVLRQTIRQLVTPNHLRGRMTSINMMFFMGGPQLGELEAGVLAGFIGAPLSVVIGGLGSLIAAAIAAVKSKNLMKFEM